MPTIRAMSQPFSSSSVYRDHAWPLTQSHSISSGMKELNVQPLPAPWQSTATISVAPPAPAPRTAALISSVKGRRPPSYIGAPLFLVPVDDSRDAFHVGHEQHAHGAIVA